MPRSAHERAFGFHALGIIRILLAADPEEVRKALEFIKQDEPTILESILSDEAFELLTGAVVELFVVPVAAALVALDIVLADIGTILTLAGERIHPEEEGKVSPDPHFQRIITAGEAARTGVAARIAKIDFQQADFQTRMNDAAVTYPDLIWPATPGVFEEA